MAVEARHLNLFPSQQQQHHLLCNNNNSEMMISQVQGNMYNTTTSSQVLYNSGVPFGGAEALLPAYNSVGLNDFPKTAPALQSDSGLTYNVPITSGAMSRKRSRVDPEINPSGMFSYPPSYNKNSCGNFSFLGEDISLQIQQQQFDVDRLISQHMEKVRIEIEEKRKRQARRIMESIEMGVMKRLRAKEEEIMRMGKMNWALEEKVKSLCIENQIWRDLAQTNEATANALRQNLEQVLADGPHHQNDVAALMDDAQSCCGSSGAGNNDDDGWRAVKCEGTTSSTSSGRWCRNCGKEESCVLLLPCRHLCLCTVCGSSLHTCPVCKSAKNASVHVNMS